MAENKMDWKRDPSWQFIGVIVAIVAIFMSFLLLPSSVQGTADAIANLVQRPGDAQRKIACAKMGLSSDRKGFFIPCFAVSSTYESSCTQMEWSPFAGCRGDKSTAGEHAW
jgi:hypothetical protein